MKIELDDEVDRILRAGMKRRPAERAMNDAPSGAHLDTDALSLYVEQAMTPALRVAYTRHLVACAACREQVAMLARLLEVTDKTNAATQTLAAHSVAIQPTAAPVAETSDAPRVETVTADIAAPQASIWERFTRYFFPWHNLAYALPVLAVVVLGVTIFLLTSHPEPDTASLIADGREPVVMNANAMNSNMASGGNMNGNTSEVYATEGRGLSNANSKFSPSPMSPDAKQKSGAASTLQESAPTPSIAPESARSPVAPSETLSPPPPPPPPGQSPNSAPNVAARTETQSPTTARKEADARRDDEEAVSISDTDEAKVARNNAIREAEQSRAARVAPAPVKRSNDSANAAASTMSRPGAMPGDNASRARRAVGASVSDKPLVTKTVGGKRFVRRGAAWVDESFVAGSALTDVRRNSTQYRALLSAEPALRAIIESLGGEVIVVTKNQAYRVR